MYLVRVAAAGHQHEAQRPLLAGLLAHLALDEGKDATAPTVAEGEPAAPHQTAVAATSVELCWQKLLDAKARASSSAAQKTGSNTVHRTRPSYNNSERAAAAKQAAAKRPPCRAYSENGTDRDRLRTLTDLDACYCSRRVCFMRFREVEDFGELHKFLSEFWKLPKLCQDMMVLSWQQKL